MNSTPRIHQFQVSPFAAKVRRCLHYKGVPVEVVNYGLADLFKIKRLNARGKTPVLEHAGQMICDSSDIVRHIEKHYPDQPVYPGNPQDAARAQVFEDWADECLYFYDLTMRSWPGNAEWLARDLTLEDSGLMKRLFLRITPGIIAKQAHAQGTGRKDVAAACADVERHFDSIEALVSHSDWLVGDTLSIADIAVISMCTVLERAAEAKALMEARPALMAWRQRVDALTLPANTAGDDRAMV